MRALFVSLVATLGLLLPTAAAAEPAPETDALPEVVGGQPADPGEDPWMAALVIHERYEPNPFAGLGCGASFISSDALVTAAHCVQGLPPNFLQVVAGSTNLLPAETERLDIRNIRVHPLNDPRYALYDFAVIQLEHAPTTFTVTPIDLVTPADAALWEPGDTARYTGWGVDELGVPISQLQEAEAPIIDDTDCHTRYTSAFFRGRTMVCVGEVGPGGGTTSPCYGDSGGPLTVLDGTRPVLVGLVLGGLRCGDPNYPAIFTQVSAGTDFLEPYLDPDSTPQRVQDLTASRRGPEGRAIVATWRPPLFDGGARITRQIVTATWGSGGSGGGQSFTIGGRALRVRIPHVPTGVRVRITVTAHNAIGDGPARAVDVPA
jgi:secreted trypsin-like serine protease